jgi:hypothetical protein
LAITTIRRDAMKGEVLVSGSCAHVTQVFDAREASVQRLCHRLRLCGNKCKAQLQLGYPLYRQAYRRRHPLGVSDA